MDDIVCSVVYDDNEIAGLTAGKVATLPCGGKSMKSDITIFTYASSGGASLNLAFGDTAPEDTGKLWVKTAEPLSVEVNLNADFVGNESVDSGIAVLPYRMNGMGTAAIGSKIYFFGGYTNTVQCTDQVWCFDTETNNCTKLDCTLPKALYDICAVAVGSKIYLFGGRDASTRYTAIFMFDADSPTTVQTLPVTLPKELSAMSGASIGSKIYLFGGSLEEGTLGWPYIYVFDADTYALQLTNASLIGSYFAHAVATVGKKIYLFGGDELTQYSETIQVFDTETNTVRQLGAELGGCLTQMGAGAIGTDIYVFGGYSVVAPIRPDTVYKFDTKTETISTLSAKTPSGVNSMGTATIGNTVYLCGGWTDGGRTNAINSFVSQINLPENNLLIEASDSKNTFRLLPNLEIGVKNVYLGNTDGKGERVAAALYRDGAWVEI